MNEPVLVTGITGITGFIAKQIAADLLKAGHRVRFRPPCESVLDCARSLLAGGALGNRAAR
jgi:nucleoside-diphosphate-sugar epimerase